MNFGAFKNGAKVPPVVPVGATVQVVLISEAMSNRMTVVISDGETEWKGNDHSTILLSFTNTFCNSSDCIIHLQAGIKPKDLLWAVLRIDEKEQFRYETTLLLLNNQTALYTLETVCYRQKITIKKYTLCVTPEAAENQKLINPVEPIQEPANVDIINNQPAITASSLEEKYYR